MSCNGDCNQGRECNCKCKMTDREEFEKWWESEFNCAEGYGAFEAWQARGELDAVHIKVLEADLDDRKREVNLRCGQIQERDIRIAELTAKLDKAKEALSVALKRMIQQK